MEFESIDIQCNAQPLDDSPFVFAACCELQKLSKSPVRSRYNEVARVTSYAQFFSFVSKNSAKTIIHLFSYSDENVSLRKWYILTPGTLVRDVMSVTRHFTEWLMTSLTQPEVVETQEVKAQDVSIDVKKLDEEINRLFAMTTSDCKTVNTLYDVVQPVAESFKKLQGLVEYHSLLKSAENVKNAALFPEDDVDCEYGCQGD